MLCDKRHSEKLTVNRQMTLNLTVNRQNDLFLTVNRQRDTPSPPVRPSTKPFRIEDAISAGFTLGLDKVETVFFYLLTE